MTSLSIRYAEACERDALVELQRRASLARAEDRAALLAHPDAIDLPIEHITEGRTLVAESGGRRMGFAVILPGDDGEAELDGLFVEPTAWRRGIGRRLLAAAEALATVEGARSIHVVANLGALDFYTVCGFAPAGEVATRFGRALRMHKAIAAE